MSIARGHPHVSVELAWSAAFRVRSLEKLWIAKSLDAESKATVVAFCAETVPFIKQSIVEHIAQGTRPRHPEPRTLLTWQGGPYDPNEIGEARSWLHSARRSDGGRLVSWPISKAWAGSTEVGGQVGCPKRSGDVPYKPIQNVGYLVGAGGQLAPNMLQNQPLN